jgi:hypothetical protein
MAIVKMKIIESTKIIVAVINSIRNLVFSAKNNQLMQQQNSLLERQLKAAHLKRYSEQLTEQKRRVKPIIEEIATACRFSIDRIADKAGSYSQTKGTNYIFRQILVHLYNAYSYEMPSGNTDNLYCRFRMIVDLQEDFRPLYDRGSLDNKNKEEEFENLLSKFFVDITYHDKFYQAILPDIEPVFILIEKHRKLLNNEIEAINLMREENSNDEIKIEDSWELDNAYKLLERKLLFVDNYFLIEQWAKYKTKEICLSQVLIVGFFMKMVSNHESWGREIGC